MMYAILESGTIPENDIGEKFRDFGSAIVRRTDVNTNDILKEAMLAAVDDMRKRCIKLWDKNGKRKPTRTASKLWGILRKRLLKDKDLRHTECEEGGEIKKPENEDEEEEEEEEEEEVVRQEDLIELEDMCLLLSPHIERKECRRSGVSERNKTERMLVRKTVENMVIMNAIWGEGG